MESEKVHQHSNHASTVLPIHHLLNGASLPVPPAEQHQHSGGEGDSDSEGEIEDEDVTDSTVSLYIPNSKDHFSTLEHGDGVLRRSQRKRTPTTKFDPPTEQRRPKKARASGVPQNDPSESLQSVSVQSVSVQSAGELEGNGNDSDSFEILPTPEAPPIEYVEYGDSPLHTVSMSVVTISSGKCSGGGSAGSVSAGDSGDEQDNDMSSVSGSDEGSVVASEVSKLTTPQYAPLSTLIEPTQHSTQAHAPPTAPAPSRMDTTPRTTAVATPTTQLRSSSSTTPPHSPLQRSPQLSPIHNTPPLPITPQRQVLTIANFTPLLPPVHEQLHILPHTSHNTTSTITDDEPELQLPYIHTESKVQIYAPTVVDFLRVKDFLNLALTPTDISKISAICDKTPIAVCRNMTLPTLPAHCVCLDLSREPLSVRYFWKLLHKAQNPVCDLR